MIRKIVTFSMQRASKPKTSWLCSKPRIRSVTRKNYVLTNETEPHNRRRCLSQEIQNEFKKQAKESHAAAELTLRDVELFPPPASDEQFDFGQKDKTEKTSPVVPVSVGTDHALQEDKDRGTYL